MSTEHGNGDAHVIPAGETIEIVFTRSPFTVQLVARTAELRMCIAVLRAAVDEVEAQLRLARVAEIQQAQADAALAEKIRREQGARR